jgi:lysozyme family protein
MTAIFNKAMDFVFRWEGGYVNDPADPGGETKFGISKRQYPNLDIRNLTHEKAASIYHADYWMKIRGDELHPRVAVALMDYAVNSGVNRAVKTLQKLVRAKQDGVIGPVTIGKANSTDGADLSAELVSSRADFLVTLALRRETLGKFLKGWMRRTHSLMAYLGEIS